MISIVRGGADSISLRSLAMYPAMPRKEVEAAERYIFFISPPSIFFQRRHRCQMSYGRIGEGGGGKNVGHVHGLPNKNGVKIFRDIVAFNNQGRIRKKFLEKNVGESGTYKIKEKPVSLALSPPRSNWHITRIQSGPHNLARVGKRGASGEIHLYSDFGKGCVTYKRAYCSYSVLYMK